MGGGSSGVGVTVGPIVGHVSFDVVGLYWSCSGIDSSSSNVINVCQIMCLKKAVFKMK